MDGLLNLGKLFAPELGAQGIREAEAAQLPGGMAALLAPQRFNNIRKASGSLFGVDTSTSKERLKQALGQLDMSTEQGQMKAVELVRPINAAVAAQMQQQFKTSKEGTALNQAQVANQQSQTDTRAAEQVSLRSRRSSLGSLVENSSMAVGAKKTALARAAASGAFDSNPEKLLSVLDPADKDNYLSNNKGILDVRTGTWVTPPVDLDAQGFELGPLNPGQHDTKSIMRYQNALAEATTPEERRAAIGYLLTTPPDNEVWKKTDQLTPEGLPKYRLFPEGKLLTQTLRDIDAANKAGKTQERQSKNVLDVIDRIESAVNSGEASTGLLGVILSSAAGSDTYTLSGDLDTILANLGYTALQEARSNSANGSSGFGQLTAIELQRLEGLISSLRIGTNKEDFLERVAIVRKDFKRSASEAKTDWTPEQWLGFESPPAATAAPLSGINDESIQAAIDRQRGNQ
jgi:hypothetical protein